MDNQKTIWNKGFITILCVNFCHQMSQQMMNTLVPKYADSLGANAYLIGLVGSVFAIASFLIRPVASPAFDSFSKKKLLQIALFGILLTFLGYAFSPNMTVLLCARFLHGACIGCVAPLSLAIAGDSLPDKEIGRGIGIFTLCQAVGQAVGPYSGLSLSKIIGFQKTFLIGVAIISVGIALSFMLVDKPQKRETYRITLDKIIEPDSIDPAIIQFFVMFAYTCIGSYLAIYGELLSIDRIGLYFSVYAIFLLITRPVSGMMIDRLGYPKVLSTGIICFALSFLIIGFSKTLNGMLLAAIVNSFGYGVCYPTLQSLVISCAEKSKRGVAASTGFLGSDFGMLLGPPLTGLLIDSVTKSSGSRIIAYSYGFRLMTIPILLGLFYFLLSWKRIKYKLDMYTNADR
ncbi:MAG: MFS transporter [Oscillospiraceae bacterium]|nr:MFS transporter [Oscillospiraceae bacterium]